MDQYPTLVDVSAVRADRRARGRAVAQAFTGLIRAQARVAHTRTLLPIGELEVTVHEPVISSSNSVFTLLRETEAIHAMKGASVQHNLSLPHAPCGNAGGPGPSFPKANGSIGAWGNDFREGGQLV